MALPSSLGRLPSYTNAPGAGGFEKLQNSPFGSGSLTAGLSQRIQQSGGLGDTRAVPVGRSTMNPERALGMMSRGTARPGQVEAALGMENLQRQRRQDARAEQTFGREQQYYDRMEAAMNRLTGGQTGGQTGGANPPPPTATGGANPPPPTATGGANPSAPNAVSNAFGKMFAGALDAGADMRAGSGVNDPELKAGYARSAFNQMSPYRKDMPPEAGKAFDDYFAGVFSSLYPTNE